MANLRAGWRIQRRVISALMIRELTTRFGRENLGFLWVMIEPLMFALLVGVLWRILHGPIYHGMSIFAFAATGYIPLTFFRNVVGRSISVFVANGSLMYHRQVKILDFLFVRFLIEMIGAMMAGVFVGFALYLFDLMPVPTSFGYLISGWFIYSLFCFSLALIVAPLSEVSEVLEKILPVTVYILLPLSGTFAMAAWLTPKAREYLIYSPFVTGVELMRYGIFGEIVTPYYNVPVALGASAVFILIGLTLCRRVRRKLVIE